MRLCGLRDPFGPVGCLWFRAARRRNTLTPTANEWCHMTANKSPMKPTREEKFRAQGADENEQENPQPYTEQRNPSLPYLNVITGGHGYNIEMNDDPDYRYAELMQVLGTSDERIVRGLLSQIVNATMYVRYSDLDALNFVVAFIKDGKPRSSTQALLLAQTAVTHWLMMETARHFANAEGALERESSARLYCMAARTFTNQVDTLRRLQTGGEQRVIVQHVSVNEGGQAAVVGHVTQQARRNTAGKSKVAPAALGDARAEPMPIIERVKQRVPAAPRKRA